MIRIVWAAQLVPVVKVASVCVSVWFWFECSFSRKNLKHCFSSFCVVLRCFRLSSSFRKKFRSDQSRFKRFQFVCSLFYVMLDCSKLFGLFLVVLHYRRDPI